MHHFSKNDYEELILILFTNFDISNTKFDLKEHIHTNTLQDILNILKLNIAR